MVCPVCIIPVAGALGTTGMLTIKNNRNMYITMLTVAIITLIITFVIIKRNICKSCNLKTFQESQ